MKTFMAVAAAALAATTAGCVNTSSEYPQPYYGNSQPYYGNSQPYYGSATAYPSGYVAASQPNYYGQQTPYATTQANQQYRDRNRDGIPDSQQVDRNRDGIPDARQQRLWP